MLDVNRLLTQVMGSTLEGPNRSVGGNQRSPAGMPQGSDNILGQIGTLGAGALAGGLAGTFLGGKRMRQVAGTALQVGAVAAVGALAYKAYQNYSQGKPVIPQTITDLLNGGAADATAQTQPRAIESWVGQGSDQTAQLLLKAMVAAAAADGHLDEVEYGRIRKQMETDGFTAEEQLLLSQALMNPSTIEELAASAASMEQRAAIYTAARLAIEPDSAAERDWLSKLATALDLDSGLKAHLDAIGATNQNAAA